MTIKHIDIKILLLATILASVLLYSCDSNGRKGSNARFSDELKNEIEKEMSKLPESKLKVAANVTSKNTSDTLFLRGLIANRLMSVKMRHEANFSKAIDYAKIAYDKAVMIEDTVEIVKELNELGTNFRRIGALTDALECHYKALAIAGVYSDSTSFSNMKNLTYAYNGIGNIALSMHNNTEAKRCFKLGLVLEKEVGSDIGLAINYANLGSIMQDELKYDSAFHYYSLSYMKNEQCGSQLGLALCHNHFGSLFEDQDLLDSAKVRYKRSYDMLISSSDKWHWLVSCVSLGRVYFKLGDLEEAEKYLVSARDIATHTDAMEYLEEAHELLAELYRQKGDLKSALKEVEQSIALSEIIRKGLQSNTFSNAQMMYLREKESREQQIKMGKRSFEQERRSLWTKVAIIIVIMGMLLTTLMIVTIKGIRKRNKAVKHLQDTRNKVFSVISSEMKSPAIEQRDTLQYIIENKNELAEEDQKRYLMQAYGSAVRQVDQLSNLLAWTHLQMGDVKPKPEAVNLCQVVTEAIDMLSLTAKQKNITFAIPYDNGIMVYADPEMLSCIVLNLLSNAIKYSYTGGEVTIKYKDEAFFMMLYIEEHGAGMDEAQISALNRKQDVVDMDMSNGLGLRLCHELANKSNGSLSVESKHHRGSTFVLTLPKPNA